MFSCSNEFGFYQFYLPIKPKNNAALYEPRLLEYFFFTLKNTSPALQFSMQKTTSQ